MVKSALPVALMLFLLPFLFLQSFSAQAMPGGGRFAHHEGQRQSMAPEQPGFYPNPQRDIQRREPGGAAETQRPQRLSPEERRQLRRDIHEAGQDIYLPRR